MAHSSPTLCVHAGVRVTLPEAHPAPPTPIMSGTLSAARYVCKNSSALRQVLPKDLCVTLEQRRQPLPVLVRTLESSRAEATTVP